MAKNKVQPIKQIKTITYRRVKYVKLKDICDLILDVAADEETNTYWRFQEFVENLKNANKNI